MHNFFQLTKKKTTVKNLLQSWQSANWLFRRMNQTLFNNRSLQKTAQSLTTLGAAPSPIEPGLAHDNYNTEAVSRHSSSKDLVTINEFLKEFDTQNTPSNNNKR